MNTGVELAELLFNTDVNNLFHLRKLRAAVNAHEEHLLTGPEELQQDLFGEHHGDQQRSH